MSSQWWRKPDDSDSGYVSSDASPGSDSEEEKLQSAKTVRREAIPEETKLPRGVLKLPPPTPNVEGEPGDEEDVVYAATPPKPIKKGRRTNHRGSGASRRPQPPKEEPALPSFLGPEYHAKKRAAFQAELPLRRHYGNTFADSSKNEISTMQEVLRGTFRTSPRKTKERGPPLDMQGIDISIISSIGFYYQYKDDNAELGSISIYKVDRVLEERLREDKIREN